MARLYRVFEINKCFQEYASDDILVGARNLEDLFDHFKDIFPDDKEVIHREDWMDDEDWYDISEGGKYKDGDTKVEPQFTDEQMKEFYESLDEDNNWPRIREIPHLWTDVPYEYLTSFGYTE